MNFPIVTWLGLSQVPHTLDTTFRIHYHIPDLTHTFSVVYAQTVFTMTSRVSHDGGCYMLPEEHYHQLLACTCIRNHMIEELHILLVRTEVELHHILRLIEDDFEASDQSQDHPLLHGSLIDLLQHIRKIRRQYYIAMMEQNACPELQSIYQRRLSNRHWTPHQLPTRTRSCPSLQPQRYTFRSLLPFDYVQLRRGSLPMFEPDSE